MAGYTTKSSARRAAKAACKKLIGPFYEAYEGVDFYIYKSGLFHTFEPRIAYHFKLLTAR